MEGGGGGDPTDVPGGQLMLTTDVDNYPGFPEGILGPELMERFRKQAERFGTEFASGSLQTVDLSRRPFALDARRGRRSRAETLIVATGARARWLGLPEELEFRTKIGGVSACATCDGFFYKGKDVLVVGGGDTAMEEATFLTKFAQQGDGRAPARHAARLEDHAGPRASRTRRSRWLWDSVVEKILGGAGDQASPGARRAQPARRARSSEVPAGGIFMAIGHEPNTALFRGQLDMDAAGYLRHARRHHRHQRARRLRGRRRAGPALPPGGDRRGQRLHGRHRRRAVPGRARDRELRDPAPPEAAARA